MSDNTPTDKLINEMVRCCALRETYLARGDKGAFGAALLEGQLRLADKAIVSGDPIAMLRAYTDLQSFKD